MSSPLSFSVPAGLDRLARGLAALRQRAQRVHAAAPRPIAWLLARPQRLLTLVWLVALLAVGCLRVAAADDIISGPNLAHGQPPTLFERFDLWAYQLTVKPDNDHSGFLDLGAGMLQIVGWFNMILLWACLGLVFGALTLLEWLLGLTLYQDSAPQIDQATRMFADHVFWPLIPATVAIGAFVAYAQWRGDGRGFLGDLLWVVSAVALACGIAAGPSTVMSQVDGLRQDMATGVISASAQWQTHAGNPVGYQAPDPSGPGPQAGTRTLVDHLWSTYGATPWCFSEFRDLRVCQNAGHHALANDRTWQAWMAQLDNGQNPPVFGDKADYVRGQDLSRTGVLMLMLVVSLPLAYLLLRLVMAGLTAAVGLLLMLVLSLLFLTFWCIPGFFRRMGTQFVIFTLGLELQSLFITAVVSGVMVISTILANLTGQYGFFLVAVLNMALFAAATKAKSWLDMLTTGGGSSSGGGIAGALLVRSLTRTVARMVGTVATGGAGAVAAGAGAAARAINPTSRGPSAAGMRPRTQWRSKSAGLDQGPPLRARATRVPRPGPGSQLGGPRAALPSAPANTTSTTAGSSGAGAAGGTGGYRSSPMSAQAQSRSSGQAAQSRTVSPSEFTDGRAARNVEQHQHRTGRRGRVWVSPPGGRAAPLGDGPPPRQPKPGRDGVPTITSARSPRRAGRGHDRNGGGLS